jgi:photosystem II stability/assembly factor-like uncharacterized protein
LVPALRKDGFLPFYIPRPTKEPQEAIRAALTKELVDLANRGNEDLGELLSAVTPKGKKVVVILDQFEEFFLTNRTPRSRASFTKWLGESVANHNLPIAFLVGIQDKCFAKLLDLGSIPEPTSRRTTCELQSFEADRAKEILRRAAETDGVPFEPTLIEEVVKDLKQDEFVRPAELQIVGQQLRRERIFTKSKYVMAGYAEGILSSYISDEIEQSANRQVARLVLRLMCAEKRIETKSPEDLSLEDIVRQICEPQQIAEAAPTPREIRAILKQFVQARILIHTDADKYNLVHDYLAAYVRRATEGVETRVERANRLLKRYVAEYKEDPRSRIPIRYVREIQKYASADLKGGEKAQELIGKSLSASYTTVAGVVAALILTLLVIGGYFLYRESLGGVWTRYAFKEVGNVSHIAVQPGNEHIVWAVVEGGRYGRILHRSEDGGDHWESISETTPDQVTQMVVGLGDRGQPLVYMGNEGKGVYVFDWESKKIDIRNSGLHSLSISELALDSQDHSTIYLGSGDRRGIYVSTDFGNSWQQIGGDALSNKSIASIAVLAHPRRVYVLTEDDLVWLGDGRTAEWKLAVPTDCNPEYPEINCDPAFTLYGKGRITNLVADTNNRRIYAATTARLVEVWDDSTQQWTVYSIPQAEAHEYLIGITVTGGDAPLLYVSAWRRGGASLYRSQDGGQSWDLITAPQLPRSGWSELVSDPTSNRLYVASGLGAARTVNGGQDWSIMPLRFPPTQVYRIYASSAADGPLYVAQGGSIYRGNPADAQSSWTKADNGLDAVEVRDLIGDPRNPEVLYAGAYSPRQWSVFVTRDRGQHWELLGLPAAEFRDDDTVSLALAMLDGQRSILFAGTNGSGILRAELGSEQKQTVWSHCPADVRTVQRVLVPPWSPHVTYALGDGRTIVRSADAGLTWAIVGKLPGTAPVNWLEAGGTPDNLYVSSKADGILHSVDGGGTWRNISARLPDHNIIFMAVDSSQSDVLYVVTKAGVIYRSADAGGNWENIRENLDVTDVRRLIVHRYNESKIPRLILAGDSGVYYYTRNKFLGFEVPW